MSVFDEISPTQSMRVIDLVRSAGIDVSDWSNFAGGEAGASRNPNYCYEWAFVEHERVVVLNLWLKNMVALTEDVIEYKLNFLKHRDDFVGIRKKRRERVFAAIGVACASKLPIRVIVLKNRPADSRGGRYLRKLDATPWAVMCYDTVNGDVVLRRDSAALSFVDQFSLREVGSDVPQRRQKNSSSVIVRNPGVRKDVLLRALGICEYCGELGFKMASGAIFLETHHVVPLSEGGRDKPDNVVAICPNDHRESHFGLKAAQMRDDLIKIVEAKEARRVRFD